MIVQDTNFNVIAIIMTHNQDNNYLCQLRKTRHSYKIFQLEYELTFVILSILTLNLFKTTIDKCCS